MPKLKITPVISYDQIIAKNNQDLKMNLIPAGYPKWEVSKVHDEAFTKPIELPSYKIEKLLL